MESQRINSVNDVTCNITLSLSPILSFSVEQILQSCQYVSIARVKTWWHNTDTTDTFERKQLQLTPTET